MGAANQNVGPIAIRPIGVVHSSVEHQQTGGFRETESRVELWPEYSDYLVGLDEYSHLTVIYWLNEMSETHGLHRPQDNPEVPVVGMFACR